MDPNLRKMKFFGFDDKFLMSLGLAAQRNDGFDKFVAENESKLDRGSLRLGLTKSKLYDLIDEDANLKKKDWFIILEEATDSAKLKSELQKQPNFDGASEELKQQVEQLDRGSLTKSKLYDLIDKEFNNKKEDWFSILDRATDSATLKSELESAPNFGVASEELKQQVEQLGGSSRADAKSADAKSLIWLERLAAEDIGAVTDQYWINEGIAAIDKDIALAKKTQNAYKEILNDLQRYTRPLVSVVNAVLCTDFTQIKDFDQNKWKRLLHHMVNFTPRGYNPVTMAPLLMSYAFKFITEEGKLKKRRRKSDDNLSTENF